VAKETDWEAVEREYRAGVVSLREIGRAHGVSDTAIRKRAAAEGWVRDLIAKVKERTRDKLVRSAGSHEGSHEQQVRTDAEIVEQASDTQVTVVKTHRRDIALARDVVGSLYRELAEASARREELADAVEDEIAKDSSSTKARRRTAMMKALSLPSRASAALALAGAMRHLVGLERQAFNIESGDSEDDAPPAPVKVTIEDASVPDADA
jgi:hypothetical protein